MSNITKTLIKGSSNSVDAQLTEDGNPLVVNWTQLDVQIGPVTLTRTANQDGVDFSSGVLTITPGLLVENLDALVDGTLHRVIVKVTSASLTEGAVFGGDDSDTTLHFEIEDEPIP